MLAPSDFSGAAWEIEVANAIDPATIKVKPKLRKDLIRLISELADEISAVKFTNSHKVRTVLIRLWIGQPTFKVPAGETLYPKYRGYSSPARSSLRI